MMNANEIAEAWKEIVKIYNETREIAPPEGTMCDIIHKFGIKKTEEVFATIAAIKKYDGRIYGKNRDYMNSIPVDSQIVEWRSGNPVIYAGLDDIHTAHINQLIQMKLFLKKHKRQLMKNSVCMILFIRNSQTKIILKV